MFSKLRAWWRKGKEVPEARYGSIDDRGVFRFRRPSGSKFSIDVFDADRRLREHGQGEAWAEHIKIMDVANAAMQSPSPAFKATAQAQLRTAFSELSSLSRKVFGLSKDVDGPDGWTDTEAFALFIDFIRSLNEIRSEFLPLPSALARPAG